MTFRHDRAGTSAEQWRAQPGWSGLVPLDGLDARVLDRVVVVGAHPDDESLGAGLLLGAAHDLGLEVEVVVATRGEASHPRSPTYTPAALAAVRGEELRHAVATLAPGASVELLDLPDGQVAGHEEELLDRLLHVVGDGRRTLVVAPYRHDGHPDHEAAGRAAATVAVRTGARLLEYPVWWWHWARPDDADWTQLRALRAGGEAARRKARSIAEHRSQVAPVSDRAGDEVLLDPAFLAHFTDPVEVFVESPPVDAALDDLHAELADPWGVETRWYERRKRDLLLASLPRADFRRGLEVGCSTGALSAALAERCGALLALDASPHAVRRAAERLAQVPHADVQLRAVPEDWPEESFDLIVVSEVGYFLSPAALDLLVERVRGSLSDDGVLVLCHWRHPVAGWVLDGPDVHERFRTSGLRPVVCSYADRDVELVVLGDPAVLPRPDE